MAGDLFGPMEISAAGLRAQRKRMETIAKNLANVETTRDENGGVYRRKRVLFSGDEGSPGSPGSARPHKVSLSRTSSAHLSGGGRVRSEPERFPTVQTEVVEDPNAGTVPIYDPSHPDADEKGYVHMPDINTVTEMVDMIAATRAYEANLAAMKAYQNIVNKSLEI